MLPSRRRRPSQNAASQRFTVTEVFFRGSFRKEQSPFFSRRHALAFNDRLFFDVEYDSLHARVFPKKYQQNIQRI